MQKKLLSALITLFFFISCTGHTEKKKTVCLNMIVKDESKVIERCLASAKPLIDYWVIVDTGSTDGTQQIIKEFMKDIPGELHEHPWKNFEYNRNHALEMAKGKSDYVLFIDADEEFSYEPGFQLTNLDKDLYDIKMDFGNLQYYRVGLVNQHLDWRWEGVLHEYLVCPEIMTRDVIDGMKNVVYAEGARSCDPQKYQKDVKVLEEALLEDPYNRRYVFYLAQSYYAAGELEKAVETYQRRIAMEGWDQEVFWSKYQIGMLYQEMGKDPSEVIKAFTDAYIYRPTRAEPLVRLATYCRTQGLYLLGYTSADMAASLPFPSDNLFVEKWMYDYWSVFERSICSYWIGKYAISKQDCEELLENSLVPEGTREQIEANLAWANMQLSLQSAPSYGMN